MSLSRNLDAYMHVNYLRHEKPLEIKGKLVHRLVVLLVLKPKKQTRQQEHLERWRERSFHPSIMTDIFFLLSDTHTQPWVYGWLACSACYCNYIDSAGSDHFSVWVALPSLCRNLISQNYDDFHEAQIMGSDKGPWWLLLQQRIMPVCPFLQGKVVIMKTHLHTVPLFCT